MDSLAPAELAPQYVNAWRGGAACPAAVDINLSFRPEKSPHGMRLALLLLQATGPQSFVCPTHKMKVTGSCYASLNHQNITENMGQPTQLWPARDYIVRY